MLKKSVSIVLFSLFLAACAHTDSSFTRNQAASIIKGMGGNKNPKIYVYSPSGFLRSGLDPFLCSVDGNSLGYVTGGEYVLAPVPAGQHTIFCTQTIPFGPSYILGLFKGGKNKGTLEMSTGTKDTYIIVDNGLTTLSELKIVSAANPPEKFEEYQLNKSCTSCQ